MKWWSTKSLSGQVKHHRYVDMPKFNLILLLWWLVTTNNMPFWWPNKWSDIAYMAQNSDKTIRLSISWLTAHILILSVCTIYIENHTHFFFFFLVSVKLSSIEWAEHWVLVHPSLSRQVNYYENIWRAKTCSIRKIQTDVTWSKIITLSQNLVCWLCISTLHH